MKTFLTLCICAMVSAGIYGFVDMAGDVRHGTMIEYDRGEKTKLKSVTIERLKMAQGYKSISVSQNAGTINLKDKIVNAKPEVAVVTPAISVSDFIGKNYSRSAPVEFVDADYFRSSPISLISSDTTKTETTTSAATETAGTDQPIPVALATTEQPIYIIPAVDTSAKVKDSIAPQPVFEFESFGRGNPGRRRKKEVVVTPSADTTNTIVKKDNL